MWYFFWQTTCWRMQARRNTSSTVWQKQDRRNTWAPSVRRPGSDLARGPPTLLLNTPNPQLYCLLRQWWLPFVEKHNSSGQSLPAASAPSQRHTVYNPLYSLARSHPRVAGFHELAASRSEAWVTTRMSAFRAEKQLCSFSRCRCRPLRQQSDTRGHENKSLLPFFSFFNRKSQWQQANSGNRCRRWECLCKNKLLLS